MKIKERLLKLKNIRTLVVSLMFILVLSIVMSLFQYSDVEQEINLLAGSMELSRALTYEEFVQGDEDVDGTENVKFSAFFLRDLDADGYAEQIKGTCKQVGDEDNLYMEIKVQTEGFLKNAKIEIDGKNFYLQTSLPKDEQLVTNYIGSNVKEIAFNEMSNGTQKLITGVVRSGTYSSTSTTSSAIGLNINNYSRNDNKIILTGIYVSEDKDGNTVETEIRKEVVLAVDWYAEGASRLYTTSQTKYDIDNRVDEENGVLTLDFSVNTEETKNQFIINKNHVKGTIPQLEGYDPIEVNFKSGVGTFEYDPNSREFIIVKSAEIDGDGNVITSISRKNSYGIEVKYPIDAFYALGSDRVVLEVPVETYHEGFNNSNSEFENPYITSTAKTNILASFRGAVEGTIYTDLRVTVGDYTTRPSYRYVVSKQKPLKIYNGVSDVETNDRYKVSWYFLAGQNTPTENLKLSERENSTVDIVADEFMKSDSTRDSMEDITTNVGVSFSNPISLLGEEGWLKVYNDETDELLLSLDKSNFTKYTNGNYFYYEEPVKHIRVETSSLTIGGSIYVYNLKELDDEYITTNYTKEEFDNLQYIRSAVVARINDVPIVSAAHQANYEAPISVADISLSTNTISTQKSEENFKITITTQTNSSYNEVKWKDGTFLVKIPEEIIDVEINSVEISNVNVNIDSYEIIEQDGIRFIKIVTSNEALESYSITIDTDISPDPRKGSSSRKFELYAYNENLSDYYYRGSDIYDVNNNLNVNEIVNYYTATLNMVSPNSLLTNQTASNFDNKGTMIISPQVADITPILGVVDQETEEKTAKIGIQLKNNYSSIISEIVVLGAIPFEGNRFIVSSRDLGSTFDTKMINTGIELPEEVIPYATVYYTENKYPTKEILDKSNGWKLASEVENWDDIKCYIIDLADYEFEQGKELVFSYSIKIPNGLEYNKVSFSHHGVYFCLNTDSGKYRTNVEPNKIGLRIVQKYNIELTKYQTDKTKVVPGATYKITAEGEEKSTTAVTGTDGKLVFRNLYVEKNYVIEEIKVPNDYVLNTDVIKLSATVNEADLVLSVDEGNPRDDIVVEKLEGQDYKAILNVEDDVRAKVRLIKTEKSTDIRLKNAKYKILGTDFEDGKVITTDENGEVTLNGLKLDEEYILEEVKAPEGYYLNNDQIKFVVNSNNGNYTVSINDGTFKNNTLISEDEIPVVVFEVEDEKIPTYNLVINKVVRGETTPLPGAKFRLYYGKKTIGTYEADENGQIFINGLYQYVEAKGVEQKYTLKEIYAPEGFAKVKDIEFEVERVENVLTLRTESTAISNQVSEENSDTLTINVDDPKSFKLTKIDGETAEVLPGTKFAIYNIDKGNAFAEPARDSKGNIVGTETEIDGKKYYIIETNEQGEISANLTAGLYKAVEIEASNDKYDLGTTFERTYYFGIGESILANTGEPPKVQYVVENMSKTNQSKMIALKDNSYIHLDYDAGNITKFSIDGNMEWRKTDTTYRAFSETNDNMILTGTSSGKIIKYDLAGNIIFERSVSDSINSIDELENGGYIVGTSSNLIKLNDLFEVEWTKSGEVLYCIESNENEILVSSSNTIYKYTLLGNLIWEFDFNTFSQYEYNFGGFDESINGNIAWGAGTSDKKLYILDKDGNVVRDMEYSEDWGFEDIIKSKYGGFICSGWSSGSRMIIPAEDTLTGESIDINFATSMTPFVMKITEDGLIEWVQVYQTYALINSVCEDYDGNYIMTLEQRNNNYTFEENDTYTGEKIEINNTKDLVFKCYAGNDKVQEQSEVIVENVRKEFKIITEVETLNGIYGGTISGEGENPYEIVKYGDSSVNEIKITPAENYEIAGIKVNDEDYSYIKAEDGSYIMPLFENVTEDIHVVARFVLSSNKMVINKVDGDSLEKLPNAKFKLDQIEERTEPENVIGILTDNSKEHIESNYEDEKEVIGSLTDNGVITVTANKELEVTGVVGDIVSNGTYYFVEKDGKYIPTNGKTYRVNSGEGTEGVHSSTAYSYLPIDLTALEGEYAVVVNASVSSESGYDYGYATISQDTTAVEYTNPTNQFMYISGTGASSDHISTILTGGNMYYLHIGYRKDSSVSRDDDQVVINSINVYEATGQQFNFIEVDGKYESTNQGINNSTSNSYIPIDLSSIEGNYMLHVKYHVSSESSSDYGFIHVTENTNRTSQSNSTNRLVRASGTNSDVYEATKVLTGGKIYYLHMGYYKNNSNSSGDDKFVIDEVKVYGTNSCYYNFVEVDGKYESTNQGKKDSVSNSYIPIDLTGYSGKYNVTVNANVSSESGSDYGYAAITNSTSRPSYSSSTGRFIYISGTSNSVTEDKDYNVIVEGGRLYYLHFGYYKNSSGDSGDDKFTINSVEVSLNDSDLYHGEVVSNSEGQAITQVPFGKYAVTEIEAPNGYELNEEVEIVEFRDGGTNEFTIENQKLSKIIVHHYIKGTETKLVEDVIFEGKNGTTYTTSPNLDIPKYELEIDGNGDYILPDNATGIHEPGEHHVNYYYVQKQVPITVKHLIEGTDEKVPLKDGKVVDDVIIKGYEGEAYTTTQITNEQLSDSYEISSIPSNANGVYIEETEIIYYYKSIERNFVINKFAEDGVTPLSGIKFTIDGKEYITNENGKIRTVLEAGRHEIKETETLEQYKLIETPYEIMITRDTVEETLNIINERTEGKVIVEHYKAIDNGDGSFTYTDEKLVENEEKIGVIGEIFATKPHDNIPEYYEVLDILGNSSGTYEEDEQIVKYYYNYKDYDYTVEYYYDGILNPLNTDIIQETYLNIVDTYQDKNIEGYVLDHVEGVPLTISTNTVENIIKVYYIKRSDLSYTVNYLEQGTNEVLAEAKIVNGQTFKSEVTENAIEISGYDKVDPVEKSIVIEVEGNVINFYYTKRTDLSYTVNYLEEGSNEVLAEAKVVNGQTYKSTVTENAIEISGYDKVDPIEKSIVIEVENNVINFYYTKRTDLSYTVNYLEQDTNEVLADAKVVIGQTYKSIVTETAIEISGYDRPNPDTQSIVIEVENNVINFYYTKRTDLSYTVNYLEKDTNEVLAEAKVVENQTYKSTVTETAIEISGYDKPNPDTQSIAIEVENNIINFYYTKRTDLSYTVNYLEEGNNEILAEAKVVNGQRYKDTVTEAAIEISGYDKVNPVEKSIVIEVEGNVINFYYTKRTDLSYTVNYLEEGNNEVLAEAKIVNSQKYKDTATETAIEISGYDKVDPVEKSIVIEVENNVINFYYTKRVDLSYTVNYLEEGTNEVLAEAKVVNGQRYKDTVTEIAIDISGYDKVAPVEKSIVIEVEGNVINFYYTKRTDLSYIVNYLEQDTNEVLAEAKVVEGQTYKSTVTETAIEISGYDKVAPVEKSIVIEVENNVINFYYTKRTDLNYTVNYLEQDTNEVLAEAKIVNGQTYKSTVTESAIEISGYDKVAPVEKSIVIEVEGNVINFYYTKRTDLSYTVNYLEKDTNEVLADAKVVENQTYKSTVTETAIEISGYDKPEEPQSIVIEVEGNVINFYYTKRTDLSYTVNYLEQGTNEVLAEEKVVEGQTYKSVVTETAIEISGYDRPNPDTQSITIEVENNTINFYYIKRTDLGYTVNYLEKDTNEVLAEAKVVWGQRYKDTVTEFAIDISGYDKTEESQSIVIEVENNIINFYYTKRTDLSYTVNYLEEGTNEVLAEAKIVNSQRYKDTVTETAIEISGYDKVDPVEKSIVIEVEGNVINFYYTKRVDLSYTVNYLEQDTNEVLAEAKVVNGQTYKSTVTEYAIDISGYDKVDPVEQSIVIEVENNVINFYYTKRVDLRYTVNYLEEGSNEVLAEAKVVNGQTYKSTVTENAIEISGYDKVEPIEKSIVIKVEGNVINFYYTKRTDLSYTVNYLEKDTNEVLAEVKVVAGQKYKDTVTEVAIEISGYDKVEPIEKSIEIEVEGNVINFYYTKRTDLNYTVNYLEEGSNEVLADVKVVNGQTYKSTVTESAIEISGYDKVDPVEQSIVIEVEGNVINFYYTKRTDLSYTVNYLEEGSNEILADVKVVNGQTYKSTVTENAIEISGYDKVDPVEQSIVIEVEGNEINFYYTKRTDLSYIVNYLEQDTNEVLAEAKVVENQRYKDTVTEVAIEISGYDKVDPVEKSIVIEVENNVINFYYTKRIDLSYTVNYLEEGSNEVLAEAKVVENQRYKDTVTETAIEISGYDKVDPVEKSIVIEVENNVINFYYTKRTDLSYTVNYLEEGSNEVLAETKVVTGQTYKSVVTENAIEISGYNKVDPVEQSIVIEVENNVINFYYTKRTDLSYTVNYLEKDTNEVLAEAKVVNGQTYKSVVTENAIEISGYDKVDPVEKSIVIEVEGNVINFYYTKRVDLSYTVNYLEEGSNEVLAEAKVVNGQTYKSTVTENAIEISGYDKVDPVEKSIVIEVENNVINFYYTKRTDLSYTVNYLEEGSNEVLAEAKVVTGQTYKSVVTETAIEISGYDRPNPDSQSIVIEVENNIINFYYTKRIDLSYTVNYLEEGSNEVLAEAKIVNGQTYKSTVTESAIEISGYDKVDPVEQSIVIEVEGNIINFYYTKRTDLSYTVNYLEQGTNEVLAEVKVVTGQTYKSVITETAIDILGYDKVDPVEQSIVIEVENNIINFYYTKRTDLEYIVNYLELDSNEVLSERKVVGGQTYKSTVIESSIEISGYDKVEPIEQSIVIELEENVINFYYTKRTDLSYRVEYYFENQIDESLTDIFENQTYKDIIETYDDKVKIGYKLDRVETIPMSIGVNENVIKVFYIIDENQTKELSYTIEYYKDNNLVVEDTITATNTVQVLEPNIIEVDKSLLEINDKYIGYEIDYLQPTIIPNEVESGSVLKVYYKRKAFNYKVEYYFKGEKDESLTEINTALYGEVINTFTDKNKTGYYYDYAENLGLVISENEISNIIKVYYEIDGRQVKELSYKIEYYKDGILTDTETELTYVHVLATDYLKVNLNKLNLVDKYPGYKFEKTEPTDIPTLVNNGDVIKIFYVKDEFEYRIEYYYDGIIDPNETIFGKAKYGDIIDGYTDKLRVGYGLENVENNPLTITENVSNNIMKVYYVKSSYGYTIEYYYDGVLDSEKTENRSAKYGTIIESYIDKNIYGYRFDKVENLPLTVLDIPENNVIKVYYVRKDSTVTVQYIDKITGEKLEEDIVIEGKVFDTFDISNTEKQISEYELLVKPEITTGTFDEEPKVFTYEYAKITQVIVKYLENETNIELLQEEIITGYEGLEYETQMKDIENYTFVKDTGNTKGNMTKDLIEVVYYYAQKTKVKVNHIDKNTNEIIEEVVKEGKVGDEYISTAKDIEDYVLVEKPEEEKVIMTKEEIVLNYYYVHVSSGVVEKHIDINSGVLLDNEIYLGNEGDIYETNPKEFEGYDLVEEKYPENAKGKMTIEPIYVKYYYVRKTSVIVEHIDIVTNKKIAEKIEIDENADGIIDKEEERDFTEIIEGHENEEYKTNPKTFDNYDIVEEKYPENAEGTMEIKENENGEIITTTIVKYYYHHRAKVTINYIDEKTGEKITVEHIPGYEGDPYNVIPKEYEGYELIMEKLPVNNKSEMTKEEIIVNYYYIAKAKVIINYIDLYTGETLNEIDEETKAEVSSTIVIEGYDGDSYESNAKIFEGYDLREDKLPDNANGTMKKGETIVNYYYSHRTSIKVLYIEKATGVELIEPLVIEGYEGDYYKVEQKEVLGYRVIEVPEHQEGYMKKDEFILIYYYAKKSGGLTVIHKDINEDKNIYTESFDGNIGDNYDVTHKNIIGYEVVQEKLPENNKGTLTEEKTEVIFYYSQRPAETTEVETPPTGDMLYNSLIMMSILGIGSMMLGLMKKKKYLNMKN